MRPSGVLLLTGLSLLPVMSGCGVDTYENRLKAANAYYAYREDIDTSLDRKWVGPFGVSLRVPMGFREVAPPKKDMPDDRMNSRFTRVTDLPGLLAKWEMPVQTEDAGNQVAELFLLGNHQRFLDHDPQKEESGGSPATFLQDYDNALQTGLNITMTAPSGAAADNAWLPGRVPTVGQIPYTQTKNYEWAKLSPPENPEVMPHRVGYTSRFEVPVNRNSKLQVILLCLYPAKMRDSTKLTERLTKTMEQLEVPAQMPIKPKPGQKVGAPAPANNF